MRTMRLALGAAVAAFISLALATPASAVATTININGAQVPTTAAAFKQSCTGPFDPLPAGKDGWHFILPAASGTDFVSLSLTFSSPGGTVNVVITGTQGAPSTGTGWSGYIDNAGDSDKHAYLFTDAGWTLTAGTASAEGAEEGDTFNLSHTCAGTPTSGSPSPSPSPRPSGSKDPSTSASASTPGGDLPRTGVPLTGFVVTGLVMLAGGAALLAVRRRRDIPDEV